MPFSLMPVSVLWSILHRVASYFEPPAKETQEADMYSSRGLLSLAPSAAAKEGFCEERLKRLGVWAKEQVDEGRVAGMLVAVSRHGRLVLREAHGVQSVATKKPIQPDTIFRIFSMTKPIASVAIMMLYEQGRLQIDDPIAKYAKMFASMHVAVGGKHPNIVTQPASGPITIQHLLTHTSGFTYGFVPDEFDVHRYYEENKITFTALEAKGKRLPDTLESVCTRLAAAPLLFHPGKKWNYGVSTDVLGYIVEVVSGMAFEDFVRTQILEPLHMVDTDFFVPQEKRGRFATCYLFDPQASAGAAAPASAGATGGAAAAAAPSTTTSTAAAVGAALNAAAALGSSGGSAAASSLTIRETGFAARGAYRAMDDGSSYYDMPTRFASGGGGLVSTVTDYLRFCQMLLNGGALDGVRLLAPSTVHFMLQNHLEGDMADMGKPSFLNMNRRGQGFGLGFAVVLNPQRLGCLCEPGDGSWGGMASTFFFIDPRNNIATVLMTQLVPSSTYNFRRPIRTLVYQALTGRAPFPSQ